MKLEKLVMEVDFKEKVVIIFQLRFHILNFGFHGHDDGAERRGVE